MSIRVIVRLAMLGLCVTAVACAGRWMGMSQPAGRALADGYPRDLRVALHNDSVIVLRRAVLRGDSLVEVPEGQQPEHPSRGVALADVRSLERWQNGGERMVGGTLLAIGVSIAVLFVLLWRLQPLR